MTATQITVLGMHRSGTSALSGLLCARGAWAGNLADLMPPNRFNPRGYYERLDTMGTLDQMLNELGGSWFAPPLEVLGAEVAAGFRDRLDEHLQDLRDRCPEGRVLLVKDPRLNLFASQLPAVLGTTEGVAVCVRHPLAVARSLEARDGIPVATGLALWEAYNVALCRGLAGHPVRVWAFDAHDDLGEGLEDLVAALLHEVGYEPSPPEGMADAGVVRKLVHQHSDDAEEREWLNGSQLDLWHRLLDASEQAQPTELPAAVLSARAAQEIRQTATVLIPVTAPELPLSSAGVELMVLPEDAADPVEFTCNICGHEVSFFVAQFHREAAACPQCGSVARFRGLVHALSVGLYGRSMPLTDFPVDRSVRGIGMSDSVIYADGLAAAFDYVNTRYDMEPHLDVMQDDLEFKDLDFIVTSDVLEHVVSPVSTAFRNLHRMLRPGGLLVMSVPYYDLPETVEHYPGVTDFRILEFDPGEWLMVHRSSPGGWAVRDGLVFHGGPGTTVEMRLFAERDLIAHLKKAGFRVEAVYGQPVLDIGYYWPPRQESDRISAPTLGFVIAAVADDHHEP